MEFFKENPVIRVVLIIICFVLAVIVTIGGWKHTGEMAGLIQMLVGVALLLAALAIYNKPFEEPRKKKKE